MGSSVFKRADRRYFISALVSSLTHGGLDTYESGLDIATEGNKDQRAAAIVRHLFDEVEDSDTAVVDLLNHLYVESSGASYRLESTEFKQLKATVLDPRGVRSGDDGYFIESNEVSVRIEKTGHEYPLRQIGKGSYALVYKYKDDEYRMHVAVKQALRTSSEVELQRFKAEFDVLSSLSYPYILSVFRYDSDRHRYTMEFCDSTLDEYIEKKNGSLTFQTRKRIALQFLYGINYLTIKGILHRDISYRNVLIKTYDEGAVTVKLSDFGLHKTQGSNLTKTGTEMKGTIIDPTLTDFKSYSLANEIYAVGQVLSYIFTGKKSPHLDGGVGRIVRRCLDFDLSARYRTVPEIISDVECLSASS